jgi:hypothetical protein
VNKAVEVKMKKYETDKIFNKVGFMTAVLFKLDFAKVIQQFFDDFKIMTIVVIALKLTNL